MNFPLKLVRDKIPDIIQAKGGTAIVKKLSPELYIKAIKHKLVEEAIEVRDAKTRQAVSEELADLLEVIDRIRVLANIPMQDLEYLRKTKAAKFGNFDEGKLLVFTHGGK